MLQHPEDKALGLPWESGAPHPYLVCLDTTGASQCAQLALIQVGLIAFDDVFVVLVEAHRVLGFGVAFCFLARNFAGRSNDA